MQGMGGFPGADRAIAGWARHALRSLADRPGVQRVGLALAEGGGRRLRFTANDRAEDAEAMWCHVDAYDDLPLNAAVRTGESVCGALSDLDGRFAWFVARQSGTSTVAIAAVPIVAAGQVLGGYVLFYDRTQAFDPGQRRDLARSGANLGAALRQAQRREQRATVALSEEAVPAGALVAVHHVAPDPARVSEARRFLRTSFTHWGVDRETTDTAELCLSELVTNAVLHSHTGCVVRLVLDDGILTTTVRDNGVPSAAPAAPLGDPLRVHGRGLQLVDALASRWGSELDAVGTTVWFVLEHGTARQSA